jgi:uncharacterized protein (DUF1800 family)
MTALTAELDAPAQDAGQRGAAQSPPDAKASPAVRLSAVVMAGSALAACGGGGGSGAAGGTSGTTVQLPVGAYAYTMPQSNEDAARFLLKAQFSASEAEIAGLRSAGYKAWLESQLSQPVSQSGWDWLNSKGYGDPFALQADGVSLANYFDSTSPADYMVWSQLMTAADAPRKRMALALSEIMVVSLVGLELNWRSHAAAAYWDVLNTYAFGNYRALLEAITLDVAMGYYLNTKGNKKADGRGSAPDENYAREVMQLFSIGLVELNLDGTPRLDANGATIDTYSNTDVSNLAHVFTGWDVDTSQNVNVSIPQIGGGTRTVGNTAFSRRRMVQVGNSHSTVQPTFLGTTLTNTSPVPQLTAALDVLFNHANTAPFICKQLIQRLVTSNPSPAYVRRVATVFLNNGSGVRGDLASVYAAILRDDEARGPSGLSAPEFGKVREPMLRLVQWARTFGATSVSGNWKIGDLSNAGNALGQSPLRSGSVFNFFRPGYVPPATALSAGTVAPEFQLINESSVAGYLNYMQDLIGKATTSNKNDIAGNPYTIEIGLALSPTAASPGALINRLNLLLCGGQLSVANVALITSTVGSMAGQVASATTTAANLRNRVCAAILMVMASSEYIVQK